MTAGTVLSHDWFPRPLPSNVQLGARTWCYSSFCFLHYQSQRPRGVRIGHDTGIYHGTFFDLGPEGEVEIGNFCTLVGAIISTNGRIVIGDYTFIAHEVVLADAAAALPEPADSRASSTKSIVIGENCWIGARAVLLAGAQVGPGAIVGAGAVVDFNVPAFGIVAGNPARLVGSAVDDAGSRDNPKTS
ncbi:MAG: acyltransferase [Verrucomicrobiales bacterium]